MTHSQLLGSDHSYCQRRIGELEAELQVEREKLAGYESSLEDASQRLADRNDEIKRLRAENDRLRADCEASADHFVSLDADRRYLWAKRRELQAAHKRLRTLVGDLAKAHAGGGFIELDSTLANELAAVATKGGE